MTKQLPTRRIGALLLAPAAMIMLSGCIAQTAVDIVTAPVKIASKGVDLATTSQSEADEKRGREIRRREEQLGKLQRDYDKQFARCEDGERAACLRARNIYAEIQQIFPTVPVEQE